MISNLRHDESSGSESFLITAQIIYEKSNGWKTLSSEPTASNHSFQVIAVFQPRWVQNLPLNLGETSPMYHWGYSGALRRDNTVNIFPGVLFYCVWWMLQNSESEIWNWCDSVLRSHYYFWKDYHTSSNFLSLILWSLNIFYNGRCKWYDPLCFLSHRPVINDHFDLYWLKQDPE